MPKPADPSRIRQPLVISVAYGLILLAIQAGLFHSADNLIRDQRFWAETRPVTGDVVFVDIDSRSLSAVGVWPWPRSIHAQLLNDLMRVGAEEVVFDVDFSAASTDADDAAFAKALQDAGGYAYLAAFQQSGSAGQAVAYNLPLPRFRANAEPVSVNVFLDPGGIVRSYPFGTTIGGRQVRSVASVLSKLNGPVGTGFNVDFSIDVGRIDRISAADLLAGSVAPERLAGKQVIVGASAVELRDYFVVPRFGVIPGALLQALATETLKQGRLLQALSRWWGAAAAVLIGLAAIFLRRRTPLPPVLIGAVVISGTAEALALLLQATSALLLDTVPVHAATTLLVLSALVSEVVDRGREKRAADAQLQYLSRHDPLTGAISRLRLTELLAARTSELSVILVDLRRFRSINDTLGHGQGDMLLKQVVARLQSVGPDAVARLGGDSFAILAPAMRAEELQSYSESIGRLVASPYHLADGHKAVIAASVGATTSAISGHDSETLIGHADMALTAAKEKTGIGVTVFAMPMAERLRERTAMDAALRSGLVEHQFTLAYQPQVRLTDGSIVGAEALARWSHPQLGSVSPGQFIPAAEETGLIVDLGRWALDQACRTAASWPKGLKVAVNVSPVQFELSDVVEDVEAALQRSRLDPSRLEIEITEGIFVRDFEAVKRRIAQLHRLGVSIALDDFGTGYSSLSYLGRLPIDKIKIDQSFIHRLQEDAEAQAIVHAVVSLSQTLRKTVIAEGIESASQARTLQAMGCALGQGFHFGRPMSSADFGARAGKLEAIA